MKLSFIVPPCFDHKQAAERSAGCTRVVYPAPNIYELQVAAYLESDIRDTVSYHDFAFHGKSRADFEAFAASDQSDVYLIWTVNLSISTDLEAIAIIRKTRPDVPVILMGPGPTHFLDKCLPDSRVFIARGEPELTVKAIVDTLRNDGDFGEVDGLSYRNAEGAWSTTVRVPSSRTSTRCPLPHGTFWATPNTTIPSSKRHPTPR